MTAEAIEKAKSLFMSALACHQRGELVQAEQLYRQAMALAPGRPSIMLNLAALLYQRKSYLEAGQLCEAVIAVDPHNAGAHAHLGNCLTQQGKESGALQAYGRALELQPESAEVLNNRGNLLFRSGDYTGALADYEHALQINPAIAEGHYNRGRALRELQRPEEAHQAYQRALALRPDYPDLHYDLGNVLMDLGRLDEAEAQYRQDPASPRVLNALGVLCQEQGKISEALGLYEQAISLTPDYHDAHYNRSRALLYQRNFAQAWPEYEYRIHAAGLGATLRKDRRSMAIFEKLPRWRGPGHRPEGGVAVWGEQGLGDQILFSSLLPELSALGLPVIYEVDQRLIASYRRAFPGIRFLALHEPPAAELQSAGAAVLAGSLPGMFRTSRESFAAQPRKLLGALPERVAHYRSRLAAGGSGMKVALSWRSTRPDRLGREKSVPLERFAPLLALPDVQFVDVQYGDTSAERQKLADTHGLQLLHFDDVDCFRDLEEVLAILEACDLLITTSNANAHFAGALGKTAWLLHPAAHAPFHYWVPDDAGRCPWYPSVEIVSFPGLVDWEHLVAHAAEKLSARPGS